MNHPYLSTTKIFFQSVRRNGLFSTFSEINKIFSTSYIYTWVWIFVLKSKACDLWNWKKFLSTFSHSKNYHWWNMRNFTILFIILNNGTMKKIFSNEIIHILASLKVNFLTHKINEIWCILRNEGIFKHECRYNLHLILTRLIIEKKFVPSSISNSYMARPRNIFMALEMPILLICLSIQRSTKCNKLFWNFLAILLYF